MCVCVFWGESAERVHSDLVYTDTKCREKSGTLESDALLPYFSPREREGNKVKRSCCSENRNPPQRAVSPDGMIRNGKSAAMSNERCFGVAGRGWNLRRIFCSHPKIMLENCAWILSLFSRALVPVMPVAFEGPHGPTFTWW